MQTHNNINALAKEPFMPIKQSRMLALIRAAQQFKDGYSLLAEEVQRAQGKGPEELARLLGVLAGTAPEPQSYSIIDVEAYHFRKFGKRNDRERERLSHRRLEPKLQYQQPKRPVYQPALSKADLEAILQKDHGDSGTAVTPEDLSDPNAFDIGEEK